MLVTITETKVSASGELSVDKFVRMDLGAILKWYDVFRSALAGLVLGTCIINGVKFYSLKFYYKVNKKGFIGLPIFLVFCCC